MEYLLFNIQKGLLQHSDFPFELILEFVTTGLHPSDTGLNFLHKESNVIILRKLGTDLEN